MKKLLLLLFLLCSALNVHAGHSRLYLRADTRISVEVFAPIGGYAQEIFLTGEFRLPADSTYSLDLEVESSTSISLYFGMEYLQFIVFPDDSINVSHIKGKIEISGSNAEGHKLYHEKTGGEYSTLPTNLAKDELYELSFFTDYDKRVEALYIVPLERDLQNLVDKSLVSNEYKNAALKDFSNNLFVTLYNELEWKWAKNKRLSKKKRTQISILQEQIKDQRLTLSVNEAARYPQSNAYIERKAEWDYAKYSKTEKNELFGRYAKSLPKSLQKYLTFPKELRAILMLKHYLYLSESAANLNMDREISTLKNYITLELKNTEMIRLAADLLPVPTTKNIAKDSTKTAKFYVTTDTLINVRICAPIAGFAQSFLPDSEFELLSEQMSLTEIGIEQNSEIASLDVVINKNDKDKYLKFMLFAGDSVVVSYHGSDIAVSGTNAAGHDLYLEKIVGSYETMPTNMILSNMNSRKNFKEYDKFILKTFIAPIENELNNLRVDKRFKEAAINDHKNNIYSYICNELVNHRIETARGKRKKELIELNDRMETELFKTDIEQVARYAQGWNPVSIRAKIDFERLTDEERMKLLGNFADLLPFELSAYFTLSNELKAMRLLSVYKLAKENLAYYKQLGVSQDVFKTYEEQLKILENYFKNELADTQAAKLFKKL